MKPERLLPASAAALLLAAAGCITRLDVRKVRRGDRVTPGVRYSLPLPFIEVRPAADGTVDVEVVYLPDERNTYAVEGRSILGAHDLDVEVRRGLLATVSWNGDASAVARQGTRSARRIAELPAFDALERRKQQEAEAAHRRDSSRSALLDAGEDTAAAERALRAAGAELAALSSGGATSRELRQARVAVAVAAAELESARQRRDALLAAAGAAVPPAPATPAAANGGRRAARRAEPPAAEADGGPASLTARGPVFFAIVDRVVDGRPELSLRAVPGPGGALQASFATTAASVLPARNASPRLAARGGIHPVLPVASRIAATRSTLERARARLLELREGHATPLAVARAMADATEAEMDAADARKLAFTIEADRPIRRVILQDKRTLLRLAGGASGEFSPRTGSDLRGALFLVSPTEIRVVLPDGIPDGEYVLSVAFRYAAARSARGDLDGWDEVPFTVDRAGTSG